MMRRGVFWLLMIAVVGVAGWWWWDHHKAPAMTAGWVEGPALPHARGEVGVASMGNTLMVVGGLTAPGRATDRVDVFDLESEIWFRTADLPRPLHHAAVTSAGDSLYVLGGSSVVLQFKPLSTAYVYQIIGGTWNPLPDLPSPRLCSGAVVLGNKLYVVGGQSTREEMLRTLSPDLSTLVFDLKTQEWSSAAPLPRNRDHLAVVAWQGRILALGGRVGSRNVGDVHEYTPETNSWRSLPAMPTPRSGMAAVVVNGQVHVIGGEEPDTIGGRVYATYEVFDPATWVWLRRPDVPTARHGHGAAVIGDRLYVVAGARAPGGQSVAAFTGRLEVLPLDE